MIKTALAQRDRRHPHAPHSSHACIALFPTFVIPHVQQVDLASAEASAQCTHRAAASTSRMEQCHSPFIPSKAEQHAPADGSSTADDWRAGPFSHSVAVFVLAKSGPPRIVPHNPSQHLRWGRNVHRHVERR